MADSEVCTLAYKWVATWPTFIQRTKSELLYMVLCQSKYCLLY